MGLFDFLFGRSRSLVEMAEDRIWLTDASKWTGIKHDIEEQLEQRVSGLLLVAHFPDVLAVLSRIAAEQKSRVPIAACLVGSLSRSLVANWALGEQSQVVVIAGERHPLRTLDMRAVQFAKELPGRCRVVWHISLEDPLMKSFAGDWLAVTLKKLGLNENESIQSGMISRRIRTAQLALEKRVIGESAARNAADWFEKNVSGQPMG